MIVRAAALGVAATTFSLTSSARADYLYSGPNNGEWSDIPNWTYVHDDPNNPGTNLHDPMTFYPGAAGTDLTVTTNINNGIANSNLNFDLGTATAHIGRFYIASNNSGPGSTDTFYGALTLQPQQLTINSGTLQVDSTQFAIIGRHANGKIIQNGGTFDTGEVLRFNDTVAGTNAIYEYHQGDLLSGLGYTGSNPGMRLGNAAGSQGTMIIYNDGPGHIHVKSYYSATAKAGSGGFANIGLTEFHYKNGNVRTVRVGDTAAGSNQVSLRNDKDNPATNYSSQLNFVLDQAATVDGEGTPNSVGLFSTPSVSAGGGTDYGVFYKQGASGRYLDRGSTYDGVSGRAYDPATDSFVVTSNFGGRTYEWDITYKGTITWDAGFDNVTSVAGHSTAGTDIALIGRASYKGGVWTTPADGNWSTGPWTGGTPNAVGAGANFFNTNTTGSVNVNLDQDIVLGELQFDNVDRYTLAGYITTNYTLSGTHSLSINAGSGNTGLIRAIDGSHTITAPVNLVSNTQIAVDGTNTLKISNLNQTSVNVTKTGTGTLSVNSIRAGNLNISAGTVKVSVNGGDSGVSYLNNLAIDPSAALDLNDNDLVVNNGDFATIEGLVFSGYRQGADPTATGIISTTGQTSAGNPILALFDNSLVNTPDYPFGSGHTVGANAVIGKYTYIGDTNWDGQVTPDDYGALDANLGATGVVPGIAWFMGDSNFDGQITPDDYGALDANLGLGVGNPLSANGAAAVPEPASLTLLGIGVLSLLARRRRHS